MLLSGYKFVQSIGAGGSAIVYLAECKDSGELCAIKHISKHGLTDSKLKCVRSEIEMMQRLKHPFIVTFYEFIEDDHSIYIVMEYCAGGSLCELIRKHKKLEDNQASVIATELLLALNYLHEEANIIHRDIKPENILLDTNGHIRLTDLGFGSVGNVHEAKHRTACGSPNYVAPEVIKREQYTGKVDIWSSGIVIYAMLTGTVPFRSDNITGCLKNICEQELEIPDFVSEDAQDLLRKALEKAWQKRISLKEFLSHPWISERDHFKKIQEAVTFVNDDLCTSEDVSPVEYRIHRDIAYKAILASRIGTFASGYIQRQVKAFGVHPCSSMNRASFRGARRPSPMTLPKLTTAVAGTIACQRRVSVRCTRVLQNQLMRVPVNVLSPSRA